MTIELTQSEIAALCREKYNCGKSTFRVRVGDTGYIENEMDDGWRDKFHITLTLETHAED